jgi:hypothetical protein
LAEWVSFGDFEYQWACERITVANGQAVTIKLTHNLQRGHELTTSLGLD